MQRPAALAIAGALVVGLLVWALSQRASRPQGRDREHADDLASNSAEGAGTRAPDPDPSPASPIRLVEARRQRDEMRRQIYAAWGTAPPEARGHTLGSADGREPARGGGATSPPAREPDGPLDKDYIRGRVREDFAPMASKCYEEALARKPDLAGKLVVHFTIVGDEKVGGVVESAEIVHDEDGGSTMSDAKLDECFTESMSTMTFRPPPKGGKTTVTYPFILSPDDGG